ncbi:hypothetical protein UF75_1155 [Desulfosporosinus sp. I2]|nr:hypothetical protein UF75_1155 [Desulfosporosinus sp. I2]
MYILSTLDTFKLAKNVPVFKQAFYILFNKQSKWFLRIFK